MKDHSIALALTCLLLTTVCIPAQADGFKFPTIPNPFKTSARSGSTAEPARYTRATGANISDDDESTPRETSSFTLPKPKLPKFDLPSFSRENSETTSSRPSTRTTTNSRQSTSNQNRRAEPSVFDKFSQGTKSFFSKAKTTLMPWTDDTQSTSSTRPMTPSGSRSQHSARNNGSRSRSQEREGPTTGGFTFPWSKPKPAAEEREINSATDFLKLDRPKYY